MPRVGAFGTALPAQSCATPGEHWILHCPHLGTQNFWVQRPGVIPCVLFGAQGLPQPTAKTNLAPCPQHWPRWPRPMGSISAGAAGTAQSPAPGPTSSSYPILGYPHCCSKTPLQVKGTCSAHSHRSPPCGFGNRSAGRPGGKEGLLRLGSSVPLALALRAPELPGIPSLLH